MAANLHSAAVSLNNAFKEIAAAFEQAQPEHSAQLNFVGSAALLQQMAHGAPVDIFASADQITMDQRPTNVICWTTIAAMTSSATAWC